MQGDFYEAWRRGPSQCGKALCSTLTSNKALAANYPFCTIEPNVGIVAVKTRE